MKVLSRIMKLWPKIGLLRKQQKKLFIYKTQQLMWDFLGWEVNPGSFDFPFI
jgi:hypothetical protein